MQTGNFDISDSGRIIIEDRIFYPAESEVKGLIENTNTKEKAILKEYDNWSDVEHIDAFECNVLSAAAGERGVRNLVYPRVYAKKNIEDKIEKYYTITEIPEQMSGKHVHKLSKAIYAGEFSIYSRIMAALNLAEILSVMKEHMGSVLLSIHPEEIFINVETGEVLFWIEKWLKPVSDISPNMEFGISPEVYEREETSFEERDFRYFLSYAVFRILCSDDPFDGRETLLDFPCLTAEAMRKIHSGKYGFVLAKGNNTVSEYIGEGMMKKWRAFPSFIRNTFERDFTTGMSLKEERTEITQWLKTIRRLRDCLVYVNGQFKFCDPDVPNKVLFIVVDDYKIPVWPQKAVYYYHAGIPFGESRNGVVAGIKVKNGRSYLSNLSGNVWGATLNATNMWVHPEKEIEIQEGLTISLENDKVLKVVSGQLQNEEE